MAVLSRILHEQQGTGGDLGTGGGYRRSRGLRQCVTYFTVNVAVAVLLIAPETPVKVIV